MTKEQQDLAWRCLPKEMRDYIKSKFIAMLDCEDYGAGYNQAMMDVFGSHNLTSDEESKELLFVERKKVQSYHEAIILSCEKDKEISEYASGKYQGALDALYELFGDKCLPDKEPSVQVEPKFKPNDEVYLSVGGKYKHKDSILDIIRQENGEWVYHLKNSFGGYAEHNLEPYTEPETKDNMEEKELNLCELLKGCEGEKFYTTIYGNVILKGITTNATFPVKLKSDVTNISVSSDGKLYHVNDSECVLFPSRDLYEKYPLDAAKAWDEWAEERTPKRWRAEKGEEYWSFDNKTYSLYQQEEEGDKEDEIMYNAYNYFRTEELAKQAAEAVRECLMKFHEQNQQ